MIRIATFVVVFAGCVSSTSVVCDDGTICPIGTACARVTIGNNAVSLCADPGAVEACNGKVSGDICDVPANGSCHDGVCLPTACGNFLQDHDEACDDGNTESGDGCAADCKSTEVCGNGTIDLAAGEECDDGPDHLSHDGCSSTCRIERATWTKMGVGRPIARAYSPLVYDSERHRVLLFGGASGPQQDPLGDTFEWDGVKWHTTNPLTSPQRRFWHTMAYDESHHEAVLFSGTSLTPDTWTWDGGNWKLQTPSTSPPKRVASQMTYDPVHKKVILFGGQTIAANASVYLNDTWQWDGTNWTQLAPATSPPIRAYHAMAFDPKRGVIVMFGGASIDTNLVVTMYNDIWEFDGTTWTHKTAAGGPTPRIQSAMAFDPVNQKIVVTGGGVDLATGSAEVWEWDGTSWTHLTDFGCNCRAHSMVADPIHDRVVMIDTVGDVFEFDGMTWSNISTGQLNGVVNPGVREVPSMVTDPVNHRLVSMGGTTARTLSSFNDTWLWDGVWGPHSQLLTSPVSRFGAAIAYDAKRGEIVMYGGCKPGGTAPHVFNDTWRFGGIWLKSTPVTNPPGLCRASMAYDAKRERVVLFGGDDTSDSSGNVRNDTYTWDGTDWHLEAPVTKPSIRSDAAMAYDYVNEQIVMFGGGATTDDATYTWDGVNWTAHMPQNRPPARLEAGMAWDANRKRVVMFGGRNTTNGAAFGDAWEWDGTRWTELEIAGIGPPGLIAAGVSTGLDGGIMIFAGSGTGGTVFYNDLWRLRWDSATPDETCTGADPDRDGVVGCADPDCAWLCTPRCPVGTPCTLPATCGDGVCDATDERCDGCPADCGACTTTCGDFTCAATENVSTCAGDCTP